MDSKCNQKHGAVVTRGGRVMSIATNKFRNCPKFTPSDCPNGKGTVFSYHAEAWAISRATGSTVYIARVDHNGRARLSAPCHNCLHSLTKAGVRKIIFTTNTGSSKIFI